MKIIFIGFGIFLFLRFLFVCNQETVSEKDKVVYLMMDKTRIILKSRYNLSLGSRKVSIDDNAIRVIGMYFNKFEKMTKDKGRRTLIDCLNVLLNEINANSELQNFLKKDFSILNLEIAIFVFNEKEENIYYPEISIFSAERGKINYCTKIKGTYKYYTEEQETYEEALQIIEAQNKEQENPSL